MGELTANVPCPYYVHVVQWNATSDTLGGSSYRTEGRGARRHEEGQQSPGGLSGLPPPNWVPRLGISEMGAIVTCIAS